MSAVESQVFALIEMARQQQADIKQALHELAQKRDALRREREALNQSTQTAVWRAMNDSMAEGGQMIATQAETAFSPTFDRLSNVLTTAQQAETVMRRVVLWASWRLLGWGVAVIASLGVIGWLAISGIARWDGAQIGQMEAHKVQLETQIAELESNSEDWVKTGAIGKLDRCGSQNRLCVPVDSRAGMFSDKGNTYWIIQGY